MTPDDRFKRRPTVAALVARVYRHYPRGIGVDDPRHQGSVESRRLRCAQEAAARRARWGFYEIPEEERVAVDGEVAGVVDALQEWRRLGERWRREAPGLALVDESNPWLDACYRYAAWSGLGQDGDGTRDEVVCAISILAPVYVIHTFDSMPGPDARAARRYADFAPRYEERVARFDGLVDELFGFHRLDGATMARPLPDLMPLSSNAPWGTATLGDCLFYPVA